MYIRWQNSWVEYRRFASGPDGYQPTEQLTDPSDTTFLKQLFEWYHVPFKIEDHRLFVRRYAWMDQDLMGICGLMFAHPESMIRRFKEQK
jgi:hypothetical protein